MNPRWLGAGTGLGVALIVGVGLFQDPAPLLQQLQQRIGEPINTASPQMSQSTLDWLDTPNNENAQAQTERYDSENERRQAAAIAELRAFNDDVSQSLVELDKETQQALSQGESPSLMLSRASQILTALEEEGVLLAYDPTLQNPEKRSDAQVALEQKVERIETNLIDIEQRFERLSQ
jgi:hypothetical protein